MVELHREGSAPAACAAGLFYNKRVFGQLNMINPEKAHIYLLFCLHLVCG